MSEKKIGARIVIEGEKEYREALKNINTVQKELRSEMKLCTTQFSDTQNSMEALNAKAEVLTKQIDTQKQKIEIYTNAVEASNKKQEDARKHLEDITAQYGKAEKELEQMRKATDVSNEELEKQEKVVSTLKAELSKAAESYNVAERSTSSWRTSLNSAQADLHNMEASLQKTNQYLDEAKESVDGCATSINNLGKESETTSEETRRFGDVLKANLASEVVVAGVQKLGELVKEAGTELVEAAVNAAMFADEIATLSIQTGISINTLQELTYAQELMDVSLETVTNSMAKNIKSMQNARKGSVDYVDAYKKLGVQITTTNNEFRDSEKVYWEVVDALGQVANETERDSIAMTLFGKKAQELNTLISLGSKGFQEYAKEAHDVGFIMNDEMMNALLEASDAMERMKNKTEAAKNKIGAELAPVLEEAYGRIGDSVINLSDEVVEFAEDVIPVLVDGFEWLLDNSDKVVAGITGIVTANMAMKATTPIIGAANTAWTTYKTVSEGAAISQTLLNSAMTANPAGVLISAIAGLTAVIGVYSLTMESAWSETDELNKKINENIELRKSENTELQSNAVYANRLASELTVLQSKSELTATEQFRVKDAVEQLNKMYPELSLSINENTGKLAQNTEELRKNLTQAQENEKLVALQEKFSEALKDSADAEANLLVIQDELSQSQQELNEIGERRQELLEEYNRALEEGTEYSRDFETELGALTDREIQLGTEIETLNLKQNEYQQTLNATNEEVEQYNRILEEQQQVMDEAAEATEELESATVTYKEKVYEVSTETAASIGELQTKYTELKTEALESLSTQIGLFEELSIQSDLTAQQMAANLGTQTESFKQYTEDLNAAAALMSEGANPQFDKIVQSLMNMGIDGAGYLHELVAAAETDSETFSEVLSQFGQMEEARENLSATMADMQTDYTVQMDAMLGIQTVKNEEKIANEQAAALQTETIFTESNAKLVTNTEETMTQMNTAVVESTPVIEESMTNMANKMIQATNSALGRLEGQSPKFKEIGKGVMEDLADGISSGSSLVSDAIQKSVQEAVDNVDISGLAEKIDKKLGEAFSE